MAGHSVELLMAFQSLTGDLMNNPVSWGHWFKVEVSKGNINYRWRNYAVKKATTEDNIIQEFLTKHNLKVSGDEEVTGRGEDLAAKTVDPNEAVECVDSCSNAEPVATPTNKSGLKRGSDDHDTAADVDLEGGSASTTKPHKLVCVKIEKMDKGRLETDLRRNFI